MKGYLPDPADHKIYFDHGTKTLDRNYERYQKQSDRIMSANGFESDVNGMTRKFEGHIRSESDWRKRVHLPLEFLLK